MPAIQGNSIRYTPENYEKFFGGTDRPSVQPLQSDRSGTSAQPRQKFGFNDSGSVNGSSTVGGSDATVKFTTQPTPGNPTLTNLRVDVPLVRDGQLTVGATGSISPNATRPTGAQVNVGVSAQIGDPKKTGVSATVLQDVDTGKFSISGNAGAALGRDVRVDTTGSFNTGTQAGRVQPTVTVPVGSDLSVTAGSTVQFNDKGVDAGALLRVNSSSGLSVEGGVSDPQQGDYLRFNYNGRI